MCPFQFRHRIACRDVSQQIVQRLYHPGVELFQAFASPAGSTDSVRILRSGPLTLPHASPYSLGTQAGDPDQRSDPSPPVLVCQEANQSATTLLVHGSHQAVDGQMFLRNLSLRLRHTRFTRTRMDFPTAFPRHPGSPPCHWAIMETSLFYSERGKLFRPVDLSIPAALVMPSFS